MPACAESKATNVQRKLVLYCRDCRQIMTPREADYGTIVHTCPECAASERTDAFMFLTLEDLAKWLK